MIGFAVACGQVPKNDQVIIRAGKSIITSEYLNQVLEIAKTSYPTNMSESTMQKLREKVIAELMEEVLIIERAREMGISVSDNELETAVQKIRKDYPEKTFENMLLEQAIPLSLWKKRLRKRLIIDKTIETDLQKNITITKTDIASFHHRFPKQAISPKGDHPLKNENIQETTNSKAIESFLIKEKTEDKYPQWIKGLKERYGLYFSFDGKSDA
jgi:peptidyl-prolyl cis-trans isomerase SurA